MMEPAFLTGYIRGIFWGNALGAVLFTVLYFITQDPTWGFLAILVTIKLPIIMWMAAYDRRQREKRDQ